MRPIILPLLCTPQYASDIITGVIKNQDNGIFKGNTCNIEVISDSLLPIEFDKIRDLLTQQKLRHLTQINLTCNVLGNITNNSIIL